VPSADGLLVVDYAKDGKPIGVEITAPSAVPLDRLEYLDDFTAQICFGVKKRVGGPGRSRTGTPCGAVF
jgi:hypothetical protein